MKNRSLKIFFLINFWAQGLSGIFYEPISYFLKDKLGLSASASAVFVFWMTLPFLFKPLFAALSDFAPINGLRRKPYLFLSALSATGAWAALSFLKSYSYIKFLAILILINSAMILADTVVDAVIVEQGKISGQTGFFQSLHIASLYGAMVVSSLIGGWMARSWSYQRIFLVASFLPALIFLSSFFLPDSRFNSFGSFAFKELKNLLKNRRFWILSLFIFLWSFYPFLGTAQFYYQTQELKFNPFFIGIIGALSGIAGALGASWYGKSVGKRWSIEQIIRGAVIIGAPASFLYVFYIGPISAIILSVFFGFLATFFRLSLIDLASRSSPLNLEATAYAIYMAVFNLAASASNTLGGKLYDSLKTRLLFLPHPAYGAVFMLSLIGSISTLACWPLLKPLTQSAENSAFTR